MGILDALEFLLENDFNPKRTILAGFGFDEEIRLFELRILANGSGPQGASHIADHLLDRYGKDSIEFILDEGGNEIREMYGTTFALPAIAEKVPPPTKSHSNLRDT